MTIVNTPDTIQLGQRALDLYSEAIARAKKYRADLITLAEARNRLYELTTTWVETKPSIESELWSRYRDNKMLATEKETNIKADFWNHPTVLDLSNKKQAVEFEVNRLEAMVQGEARMLEIERAGLDFFAALLGNQQPSRP